MRLVYIFAGIIVIVGLVTLYPILSGKSTVITNQKQRVSTNVTDEIAPHYVDYSEAALSRSQANGRVVLYFYAPWCSTCSVLDDELREKGSQLPADITILKVNYDTEKTLKQKYHVVIQHTLVQIDKKGNEVTRWVGGGIETIRQQMH